MLRGILYELVFYLVLPLLGWVLGTSGNLLVNPGQDLADYAANPLRLVFVGLVLAQAIATGVIQSRIPAPQRGARARTQANQWRNIAFETILILSPYCDRKALLVFGVTDAPGVRLAGILLYAAGMLLATWALVAYRRANAAAGPEPEKAPLITAGPFQRLRYPAHLGALAYSLGLALTFRSIVGVAAFLLMLNFTLQTIRREEQEKSLRYKDAWIDYCQHSWRLIPFIF
jgi:protein-S-isoprenylcysteine O-methyltransferase Ste14